MVARRRVLVVSNGCPWPAEDGGKLRVARVVDVLSAQFDVEVAFQVGPALGSDRTPVSNLQTHALERSTAWPQASRLLPGPWLGRYLVAGSKPALRSVIAGRRIHAIIWTHSYLAHYSPVDFDSIPSVVDFPNIERDRWRTTTSTRSGVKRLLHRYEALKASTWEPRVARAATLTIASNEDDETVLRAWRAQPVLIKNGVDACPVGLSANQNAIILCVANWSYHPNLEGLRTFVRVDWPRVLMDHPQAKLVLVGRGSEVVKADIAREPIKQTIHALGFVDDLTEMYRSATCVLAPALTGGGSQLKVTEALAHGRVVVGPPYVARSCPSDNMLGSAVIGAKDVASEINRLVSDQNVRHVGETNALEWSLTHSWSATVAPLVEAVTKL